MIKPHKLLDQKIKWMPTGEPERPFETQFRGVQLVIQINDFPANHLYTLFVGKNSVLSFDEWPDAWFRPAA
jgi:hypothetical protein